MSSNPVRARAQAQTFTGSNDRSTASLTHSTSSKASRRLKVLQPGMTQARHTSLGHAGGKPFK